MNLNEGASRKSGQKGLTRAPAQPPREVCERENESDKELKTENEGRRRRTEPAKNTRSNFNKGSNKEERANCGKQMKSSVRHLV